MGKVVLSMTDWEAQEVKFRCLGLDVAGLSWGAAEAPVILALHGWLDNAASFAPLVPYLLPKYRVVALDLWGHGRSSHRSAGTSYPILDYVALVEGARRFLSLDHLLLMGHSLGAGVAVLYAGSHPQHCERLLLIEGIGPLTDTPDHLPDRLFRHVGKMLAIDDQDKSGASPHKRPHFYPDVAAAANVRHRATGLDPGAALLLAARGTKVVTGGVAWSTDPALKIESQYRLTEEQVCAFLSRIDCPVGLVAADSGFKFADGPALQNRLAAIRHLNHKVVSGSHHVHMEDPRVIAEFIHSFLLK